MRNGELCRNTQVPILVPVNMSGIQFVSEKIFTRLNYMNHFYVTIYEK